MTWLEFKAWCEAQGIRDDDVIAYFDFSSWPFTVRVVEDADGRRVEIT
jgi:hypothetical protein